MVPSRVHFCCATTGTPKIEILIDTFAILNIYDISYKWNLRNSNTDQPICKIETDTENRFMVTKGEGEREG